MPIRRFLNDEKQADAPLTNWPFCQQLRDYIVTLNSWDDNHLFPFHNTLPTARFVHIQSDSHISIVHCVAQPQQLHLYGPGAEPGDGWLAGKWSRRVQSGTAGTAGANVVFTKLLGNFSFANGSISPNGAQTSLQTGAAGTANLYVHYAGLGSGADPGNGSGHEPGGAFDFLRTDGAVILAVS